MFSTFNPMFEMHKDGPKWVSSEQSLTDPTPNVVPFRSTSPNHPSLILGEILLGDKWYHNAFTHRYCYGCLRTGEIAKVEEVSMIAIAWETNHGWHFRLKCPRCNWETRTMYPGWKPPTRSRPHGGMGHIENRTRRKGARY